MNYFVSCLLALFSLNAFSICMEPEFAETHKCTPMNSSKATKWCHKKYGSNFEAYFTTEICSKKTSFKLRDEVYKKTDRDSNGQVKAACMTLEQGQKNNCEFYDYSLAERFCAENFGMKYVAFIPQGSCSMEKAARLRGEINPQKLLRGVDSKIDELESLITMIDREGMDKFYGHLGKNQVVIGAEFYTQTMKNIMGYMKEAQDDFYRNSQLNVKISSNKYVVSFLRKALRYSQILARIYKVYAVVAHKNIYVLKSYDFANLEYLNLKLKKEFALELLAKINFSVKHINDGKDIEILVSEQEKQSFEYAAISNPLTKRDYAKLVSFMGVREVVTNQWGLQRLSSSPISDAKVRSCGQGFLSFRPVQGSMNKSKAMTDLWSYDLFVTDYVSRWEAIVKASWEVPILDENNARQLILSVLNKHIGIQKQIEDSIDDGRSLSETIRSESYEDTDLYIDAENNSWASFSNYHFKNIYFPADGIENVDKMINTIIKSAYDKRLAAIRDSFVGKYAYMSDAQIEQLEDHITALISKNYKANFEKKLRASLDEELRGFNTGELKEKNREEEINKTLNAVKLNATALAVEMHLEKNETLDDIKTLQPHNMMELGLVFENAMPLSVKATISLDKDKAKLIENFFTEISTKFDEIYTGTKKDGTSYLKGSRAEREKGLNDIALKAAYKYYQRYPYNVHKVTLVDERYIYKKSDNTRTRRPIYKNGQVRTATNKDLSKRLQNGQTQALYTGHYITQSYENEGYRKDQISTGEIEAPVSISDVELKKIKQSIKARENAAIVKFAQSSPFGKKKNKVAELKNSFNLNEFYEDYKIESNGELLYNVFKALNLEQKSTIGIDKVSGLAGKAYVQKSFIQHYTSQAYQMAPILRADVEYKVKVLKEGHGNYTADRYVDEIRTQSLARRIVTLAYDKKTGQFNDRAALRLINKAFDNAIENSKDKVETYCRANYLNYKTDDDFKTIFKASRYLRATLKSPFGNDPKVSQRIKKFDEELVKDVRGYWEALNEDYLEPIVLYSGMIILATVLIAGCISTFGAAIPAAVGTAIGWVTIAEMSLSVPLALGSVYARYDTHHIRIPAQAKFSQSLAYSQIGESGLINWDMQRESAKTIKKEKKWAIGYMAMDMFFVGTVGFMAKKAMGIVARSNYKKLTGIKLRGFSAPSNSMYKHKSFKDYRKKHNYAKSLFKRGKNIVDKAKYYLPKYQDTPLSLIKTTALRQGLLKTARSLKVANKPWDLIVDFEKYAKNLKRRQSVFETYSKKEGKWIEELHGTLPSSFAPRVSELMSYGKEYSKFNFTIRSFQKAVKEKRLLTYLTNYGEELNLLRKMRGRMLDHRVKNIDNIIGKLKDVKNVDNLGNRDAFEHLLSKLTDAEILAIREVSKTSIAQSLGFKSKTTFQKFGKMFKQYDNIMSGFKNTSYMSGALAGHAFAKTSYSNGLAIGDEIIEGYRFNNDAEDIVNFYESMLKQANIKDDEFLKLQAQIEVGLAKYIEVDTNGARRYIHW